jgi:hypothetical protein
MLHGRYGNPFRPVAFDPQWRTPAVDRLARAIYDKSAFKRMTVLADALADAGCTDADLLGHLRETGPHWLARWGVGLHPGRSVRASGPCSQAGGPTVKLKSGSKFYSSAREIDVSRSSRRLVLLSGALALGMVFGRRMIFRPDQPADGPVAPLTADASADFAWLSGLGFPVVTENELAREISFASPLF